MPLLEVATVNILLWFDGLGDLKPSKSVSSLSYLVMSFKSTLFQIGKVKSRFSMEYELHTNILTIDLVQIDWPVPFKNCNKISPNSSL